MPNQQTTSANYEADAFSAGLASCVGAGGLAILCSLWSGDLRHIKDAPDYITTISWVLGVTMSLFPMIAIYFAVLNQKPTTDTATNQAGQA